MERHFIWDESTIVKTDLGLMQGYFCDGLYVYKGVPYAKAKRFQKPVALEPWDGVMDTTSFGFVAPLLNQDKPQGEPMVPHRFWPTNEDCQNLNIWTPGLDEKKRPVFVWLHGGGFSAGSAIEHDAYEGENMSREADVVVVSINHRLNILGYLDLSDYGEKYAASGNAGGDDIIAALKWIQKNIAAFGGDPDNVTVFGQSGGGAKVTTLLQSPEADGLYHKGVIISGILSGLRASTEEKDAKPIVEALLQELHLTAEEIEQLETIPYPQLAAAYNKVAPAVAAKGQYVGCIPKRNASYAGNPLAVGFREETKQVPLLVGTVFGEFTFAPLTYNKEVMSNEEGEALVISQLGEEIAVPLLTLFKEAYPKRNPVDVLSLDFLFRAPTIEYIKERTKDSAPIYSYLFDMDFVMQHGKPAWHCSDIPYFFHNTKLVPAVNVMGVTERLEAQMFEALIVFGKTGNPNHAGLPQWNACTKTEETVMQFAPECTTAVNYDHMLQEAVTPEIHAALRKVQECGVILH